MGPDHGHAHASAASAAGRHRKPLLIAFVLTAAYMVVELTAGLLIGSLALISDAAHMGTDVLALGMALAAIALASRAQGSQRTFGMFRLEVLAALVNAVLLFGVAGYVVYEAYHRISDPPEVPGIPMLAVAGVGLLVNVVSFRLLRDGSKESLNLRGAYLEVLADMLGSVGVIIGAVVIYTTGWRYADPVIGAAIGLFILPRTWHLGAQAVRIVLEIAPPGIDVDEVRQRILALPGVVGVHDLHIWTVTSGLECASGHVVIEDAADLHPVLDRVTDLLAREYDVTHATIQCEPDTHKEHDTSI